MAKKLDYLLKFDLEEAKKMMLSGHTQKQIGEKFGIPAQRVSDLFKMHGVKFVKRKFPIQDDFFDTIDSELKAYALGFLIADGCIKHEKRKSGNISYRIAFNNSIDDREAIEAIHNAICPKATLIEYFNKGGNVNRKKSFTLQWSSEYMCKKLEDKYKITPNKTKDTNFVIPENTIPDDMWRHFIRGFFDGDGHVGDSSVEFVFTSKAFMEQILNFFPFKYRIYEIIGKICIYYKVVITGGKELLKFTKDLFYKNSSIYLSRKYNLFNSEVISEITQGSETPLSVAVE